MSRTECLPRGCIAREVGWTLPVTSLRRFTRDINAIATATCCERLRDCDFPYISRSHSFYCLVPAATLRTSLVLIPGVRRIVPTVLQDLGAPRFPSRNPLLGLEPFISCTRASLALASATRPSLASIARRSRQSLGASRNPRAISLIPSHFSPSSLISSPIACPIRVPRVEGWLESFRGAESSTFSPAGL